MTDNYIFLTGATLLLFSIAYHLVLPWLSPLSRVPGPILARYSRAWKSYKLLKGDFEKLNIELHKKYGRVVRIAPNEYSINDSTAIKLLYGHGTKFLKTSWYFASGGVDPKKASLFGATNPVYHANERRKFAAVYSMTTLLTQEQYVDNCTRLLMDVFSDIAEKGSQIDWAFWMQLYALDVIGEITLGKRFGNIEAGKDVGNIITALDRYFRYMSFVGDYSQWHPWLTAMQHKFLPEHQRLSLKYITDFTANQVLLRQSETEDTGKGDVLSRLIQVHKDDPKKISEHDIFQACLGNIGAGSDTTSITLGAIFYYLLTNPEAMDTLQNEIQLKNQEGGLSFPVTFAEAQQLPYLQAVLKEAMRLHPAVGLILPRQVPAEGAVIAGVAFPAGATVGVNPWVAHYNEEVFGHDADKFRPERWLSDRETVQELERNLLTFGQGSRTCIGKNISLMEISKLVPTFLSRFEIELVNSSGKWQTWNAWFVKQYDLEVRVHKKKQISS
ncbi:uncharacterized protein A1O5_10849 [Cladophialophora psammophila CBS 110553]|uniref:Cytochrome P450 oxidoreductase n=1 Tax=Cladophialophora psammophila CBS 110553 TaxID=1182543 RepID=W9WE48_9EURO|nr:uncharacterized protein A1O5_10849 [Cladophialophora psammophila CBS 110553]EXJ66233.1 hypothetical protein A1O5_10849 [Cladophialophora psammophila CBS 110553]